MKDLLTETLNYLLEIKERPNIKSYEKLREKELLKELEKSVQKKELKELINQILHHNFQGADIILLIFTLTHLINKQSKNLNLSARASSFIKEKILDFQKEILKI